MWHAIVIAQGFVPKCDQCRCVGLILGRKGKEQEKDTRAAGIKPHSVYIRKIIVSEKKTGTGNTPKIWVVRFGIISDNKSA